MDVLHLKFLFTGDGKEPPVHRKNYNDNEALFHLLIWAVLGKENRFLEIFYHNEDTC